MTASCSENESGLEIQIRVATAQDLPLLETFFPQGGPAKHADRLVRQERGDVVYLIAWQGEHPVGHALLEWAGSANVSVAMHVDGPCPDVEDLFVAEDMRGRGIGALLLAAAEEQVAARGVRRIGLSVAVLPYNPAQRLYLQLGYRDADFGQYLEQAELPDTDGEIRLWQEMCIYLIKELETYSSGA